jgi:8-oxo-(d)GTP phosphatase
VEGSLGRPGPQEIDFLAQGLGKGAIRAAGGLLWRRGNHASGEESVEIALVHRPQYDDWSIPKGKLSPGESEIEGAVREVFEETGFRVRLGRPLGEVRYDKTTAAGTRPKVVRYWAMEAAGGSFTATKEVDELKWMSLADAEELLTHDRDRELLDKFVRGPALTDSVLLVRHARAGERSDRKRPLDGLGWQQAEGLVRLLSRFEIEEIVSADFLRCVQTVEPLSRALGLPIQQETVFSEAGYPGQEKDALWLLRSFGENHRSSVVCSQGDVIPCLLEDLSNEDHVDLPEPLPMKKGSVWALTFDGPRLFSAEYFPPPEVR